MIESKTFRTEAVRTIIYYLIRHYRELVIECLNESDELQQTKCADEERGKVTPAFDTINKSVEENLASDSLNVSQLKAYFDFYSINMQNGFILLSQLIEVDAEMVKLSLLKEALTSESLINKYEELSVKNDFKKLEAKEVNTNVHQYISLKELEEKRDDMHLSFSPEDSLYDKAVKILCGHYLNANDNLVSLLGEKMLKLKEFLRAGDESRCHGYFDSIMEDIKDRLSILTILRKGLQ